MELSKQLEIQKTLIKAKKMDIVYLENGKINEISDDLLTEIYYGDEGTQYYDVWAFGGDMLFCKTYELVVVETWIIDRIMYANLSLLDEEGTEVSYTKGFIIKKDVTLQEDLEF